VPHVSQLAELSRSQSMHETKASVISQKSTVQLPFQRYVLSPQADSTGTVSLVDASLFLTSGRSRSDKKRSLDSESMAVYRLNLQELVLQLPFDATYALERIKVEGTEPPFRWAHTLTPWPGGSKFLLFGGQSDKPGCVVPWRSCLCSSSSSFWYPCLTCPV
jgi:hypothetical protein